MRSLWRDRPALIAAVAATVFLVVVLLVGGSWWAGHEAPLRDEFARLNAPENATMLAPIVSSKVPVGISVGATYQTSLTEADVDTFYARVMAANGWLPIRSQHSQPSVSCFAKGDLRAALEFPGKSGVPWNFAIEVMWGSPICE